MKYTIFELLLVLQLISVCLGVNPCVDYRFIDMVDGLRSSDFDSRQSAVSICDTFLAPNTWYRFEHDAGNRLIETPVEPWHCGTTAPIWLNGVHPTDRTEVTAGVCATYSSENICGWNGTVRIQLCNESGSEYFVYLLAVPPGCPLAYCVDAASRKQCIPPEVWLEEKFRCGVSGATTSHSTVPLTTLTTLTTERQSLSTTLSNSTKPVLSGWNPWGPWSICSKPCDYGFQSRQRTCRQPPCEGPANSDRLCNEYSCQKLPEEKTRGIAMIFEYSESKEDTMLTVVLNQPKIHNILRKNINDICSQNASLCCGWRYSGISPPDQEFVLSNDIYPSQGSLVPTTDYSVYYQVIAVVNENIDRTVCRGHSQRIYARQLETSPNFISFDVMMMASMGSASTIFQETGLIITAYKDPASMIEDNDDDGDDVSCPTLTCIVPIVVCVTVVIGVVAIGGLCYAKTRLKAKTEPEIQIHDPPQYEEILSKDPPVNVKGLPYIVPVPLDAGRNEYDRPINQKLVDFQNVELDA